MVEIKERVHNDFIKLKNNKEEYFKEFYANNYDLVFKICFSILKNQENSEDVAQTVFEKIYELPIEKLAKNFESTWLYTVAKNEAIQFIRKNRYNIKIDEDYDVVDYNSDYSEVEGNEEYKKMMKKLNKKQEQIVSLKVISDFTFKEIGEILSIPTATVQWHYYKSIRSLKIALGNLAMFIITAIIGVSLPKEENSSVNSENLDYSSSKSDIKDQTQSTIFSNTEGNDESYHNHTVDPIIESMEYTNSNFDAGNTQINIGIISLSGIFLLISIIFSIIFIKSQQKRKIKSSKK